MAIPTLWTHQQKALDFVLARPASYLHMGMGLGKSAVAVTALDRLELKRVLVLCPKAAVRSVWPGQFSQWSPRPWLVTSEVKGSLAKRLERTAKALLHAGKAPVAIVMNWDAIRSDAVEKWIKRQGFDAVICDEMHKCKSPWGKTAKAVARVTAKIPRRIALSGTPMPHSPLDIFSQLKALDSSVLGTSFVSFKRRYAIYGGYEGREVKGFQRMDHLTAQMATITFQPKPEDVELDLPPEIHETVYVDLCPKARKAYNSLETDFVAGVEGGMISVQNALTQLLRLQQLTGGAAVIDGEEGPDGNITRSVVEIDTGKAEALRDIIEGTDEPVVVFGVFKHDLATVAKVGGDQVAELSGRCDELAEWQAGDKRILAVQIASGSEGIDLTRARYAVYLSTGFNLGTYLQSEKRVHRPGQKKPVTYYHILSRDTVDEKVRGALRARNNVVSSILSMISNPEPQTAP
tara:strand:- start:279 stop:1664 length:1386 start_codon:yes stop_codon:yes gene_type:complete